MANSEITPELLQAHAGFIRSLARGLLSDEALVDDVVQETYIKALTNGPRHREALTAWLRTVTRNLSFKALRSQGRRRTREEASARKEALPATIDLVARQQSLDNIVTAVKDLPEHYQEVVMLRFFEDLPPRHIATRLDLPVNTVRMRLHRALKALRGHLDREYENEHDWRSSLAILAGLPVPRTGASSGAGTGTSVSWTAGAIGAAGLLATAGLALRLVFGTGPDGPRDSQLEALVLEGSTAAVALVPEADQSRAAEPGGRVSIAASLEESTVAKPVVPAQLRLRVTSRDREEVSGASVLVDWDSAGLLVRGTTDSEGNLAVDLPAEIRERLADPKLWRITVAARAKGHRPSAVDQLPRDVSGVHTITLRGPGADLRGRVVNDVGRPIPGATLELGDRMRLGRGFLGSQLQLWQGYTGRLKLKFVRDPMQPLLYMGFLAGRGYLGNQVLTTKGNQRRLPPTVLAKTDANGEFELTGLEPGRMSLTVRSRGMATEFDTFDFEPGDAKEVVVEMKRRSAIRGTATRADGRPITHGTVYAVGKDLRQRYVARIDSRGRYTLTGLRGGTYELFAEAGHRLNPDVSQRKSQFIRTGKIVEWNPVLDDSQTVSGQLVGPRSGEGWILQLALESNPSMAISEVESGSDGRFEFPAVPPYGCILEVRNTRAMNSLPIATMSIPEGGRRDVVVELPAKTANLTPLSGTLLDADGKPMPKDTQVMVLPQDLPGRTAVLLVLDEEGHFETAPLQPGSYQVLVPDAGLCYAFDQPWVNTPGAKPRVWQMAPLGELTVGPPPGVSFAAITIYRVLGHATSESLLPIFHGSTTLPITMETGPGTYLVLPVGSAGSGAEPAWSQRIVVPGP